MSVLEGNCGEPSDWAVSRFGRHAGRLVEAIPEQLTRAHARAHAVHLTAGPKKRSPYGSTLAEAVRENLADTARELREAVRDLRGYEYAVINDHALFPFKNCRHNEVYRSGWPCLTGQLAVVRAMGNSPWIVSDDQP